MYNYYFAIASQNFFINQEPIEEILRERKHYYENNNKDIDFWFVINPNFIHHSREYRLSSNISNSLAAIVSSDRYFIQWLKLRIGFINTGSFKSKSMFIPN
uniref:Ycf54 n=1 Tax=Lophocladia kuetzingii TaxID=675577 RepID=A0A1Z1MNX2_9FLOR|nr:hypothetical protein [Lophocladia kuetzingii]ARW67559.1 hypothetical protein [Lophocladia kuetzingii]